MSFADRTGKNPYALLFIVLSLVSSGLSAQELPTLSSSLVIADGTPVNLRLNQTVSSAHARPGDRLGFLVIKDVEVGGFTVIPAGSIATGTITRVKGKRFLGIGGNVALELDSVELANGDQVALQARKEVKGGSRTKLMAAAMLGTSIIFWPAAPVFLLARGGDSTVLKGTEVTGHIKGDAWVQTSRLPRSVENASQMNDVMSFVPARVLNGEGREGDMVNLLFVAQANDLQQAFRRGGWVKVDKWKPVMAWHLLRHRSRDAKLPMARFYLFGRVQDYGYALPDPAAVVTRRHHLRIWKTDYAVDGKPVWAGAATHDVAIELWKHGRLINHRIDPNVDAERDFVGENLTTTQLVSSQKYVESSDPIFQAQTAAGEEYYSDSRILLLDMHQTLSGPAGLPGEVSIFSRSMAAAMSSMMDGTTAY